MLDRLISVSVRNNIGVALSGAEVEFYLADQLLGRSLSSEGRASLQMKGASAGITVEALYNGKTQRVVLAPDQKSHTFTFPASFSLQDTDRTPLKVGLGLLAVSLVLAFTYSQPNSLQAQLIRGTFALASGATGSVIPGFIDLKLKLGTKAVLTAAGALAIYAVTFFFVPAGSV